MTPEELNELDDKRFLEIHEEGTYFREIKDEAVNRKERIYNSATDAKTMNEISDKEQEIFDKDADSFKIVPEIEEIELGDSIAMKAEAIKSASNPVPNDPNVAWDSSDWEVAYFTEGNVLNAVKVGEVVISAVDVENREIAPVTKTIAVVDPNVVEEEEEDPTPLPSGPAAEYFTVTILEIDTKDPADSGLLPGAGSPEYYYSYDKETWQEFSNPIDIAVGDVIYFKGDHSQISGAVPRVFRTATNSGGGWKSGIKVSGNIMSLVYSDDFLSVSKEICPNFGTLFYHEVGLFDASELILPNVVTAGCYSSMFADCYSLTAAPELPATTLADMCYSSMFSGCSSLTSAPELPATTLAPSCYYHMFSSCQYLDYIKCLATDISANRCTEDWVSEVSATGTFVGVEGNPAGWTVGDDGVPDGWECNFEIE